ncbi:hypothetical protein LEN26_007650 [Aphanomyces euteiches]|nr:hypothetical protein LEN26_007650 [Aphanomyces euteiches]
MSDEEIGQTALLLPGNTVKHFGSRLSNLEATLLCNSMIVAEVTDLYTIDFQYNHVGELDDEDGESHLNAARAIAKLFLNVDGYVCALRSVNLAGNALNDDCVRILCTSLAQNNTITSLCLRRNPLGNEGGMEIARMLEMNTTLQSLDIGDTELGHGSLVAIAVALHRNPALKSINLDNPVLLTLEEEALQHLAKMLQANAILQHISLRKHRITDVGAQVLAERLLDNKTLTSLHLGANSIGGCGAEALAALLLSDSGIIELDLSANRIGNDGARAFETVMNVTKRLEVLSLGQNSIEDDGLARIANGAARNQSLKRLSVWGNDFGDEAPRSFFELVQQRPHDLHLDVQPYEVDGTIMAWTSGSMKPTAALALSAYLHAKASHPLQSAYLGHDYSKVYSETQHALSKTATREKKALGGICVNPLNNTLLVCDVIHACIRVLDITSLALQHTIGSKGTHPGKFLEPRCIAIHSTGTIAVSDAKVNRIQVFSMHHSLLSHFGQTGSNRGQYQEIMGFAFLRDGHLVVADSGNHRIVIVTTSGHIVATIGSQGSLPGEFQTPVAVAVHPRGNFYVCDHGNHRVQAFKEDKLTFRTLWGDERSMTNPASIAIVDSTALDSDIVVSDISHVFVFSYVGFLSHVLAVADVYGVCVHRQEIYLAQSPNFVHRCSPYRLLPAGRNMVRIPTSVFYEVMSFLKYVDAKTLRQVNKFYHSVCKSLRNAWELHPLQSGQPAVIRYGKIVEPSTGLVAVHDLYSKWGELAHAKYEPHDEEDGLDFGSTFDGAICEYFGPTFWFQHHEILRRLFDHHAQRKKLYREGFVQLVTNIVEVQAHLLEWNQCPAFTSTKGEQVPPKRFGNTNRLELLEQTQAFQLDKLMLKLKRLV